MQVALYQRLKPTAKPAAIPRVKQSAGRAERKECNPLGAGVPVVLHCGTSFRSQKQLPIFKLLKEELAKPKCRLVTDRRYEALRKHFKSKYARPACLTVALNRLGTDGVALERKDLEFVDTNVIRWCRFGTNEGLFSVKQAHRGKMDKEVGISLQSCSTPCAAAGHACARAGSA